MENITDTLASWREYQSLPDSEWRKDFFCLKTGGYLVTSWKRIEEAEKSNQETKKYERDLKNGITLSENLSMN